MDFSLFRLGLGGRLPEILQTEAAECGLACLAMVANYHGNLIDLRSLRELHPGSLNGTTLRALVEIGNRMGFNCRTLRLELEELGQLRTPCLLHWNLDHFVVLKSVKGRVVTIHDPAAGIRRLDIDEVSTQFTGVALELTPTSEFARAPAPPRISMVSLALSTPGLLRGMGYILALSMAMQLLALLGPFYLQWVIDDVLVTADRELLPVLAAGFAIALVFQSMIAAVRTWSIAWLTSSFSFQWMGSLFRHLVHLPLEYFQKRHLGDVVSRLNSVQTLQQVLGASFVEALIDGFMTVVTLALMAMYSLRLALITLGCVALYFGLRWLLVGPQREISNRQLVFSSRQQTHLLESVRGIQSLKVGGHEGVRASEYQNLMSDTLGQTLDLARIGVAASSTQQLVLGAEKILVIWAGAALALDGTVTIGMLVAYLMLKELFVSRAASLVDKSVELRMLRVHGERIADVALTEAEVMAPADAAARLPAEASLEVRDLSFRYSEAEPWVLRNLSFRIEQGECVAITGDSGCGKTTLMKLMLGLLQPTSGSILVGGVEMKRLGVAAWRSAVAAVLQDDVLFAGSIGDNISFGDMSPDAERVRRSAEQAAIDREIQAMPMGYHTLIGDMGSSLSGGQKQRVILARALYRNPRVLFLDEATSHLDVERERAVNIAIRSLSLTRIIIAHRPETIASADRVLLLREGAIADGTAAGAISGCLAIPAEL
jgi:ATP-binding cassette subfamily B protein RaxB